MTFCTFVYSPGGFTCRQHPHSLSCVSSCFLPRIFASAVRFLSCWRSPPQVSSFCLWYMLSGSPGHGVNSIVPQLSADIRGNCPFRRCWRCKSVVLRCNLILVDFILHHTLRASHHVCFRLFGGSCPPFSLVLGTVSTDFRMSS